jgi:hypothetical protein
MNIYDMIEVANRIVDSVPKPDYGHSGGCTIGAPPLQDGQLGTCIMCRQPIVAHAGRWRLANTPGKSFLW